LKADNSMNRQTKARRPTGCGWCLTAGWIVAIAMTGLQPAAAGLPRAEPEDVGLDGRKLAEIDRLVAEGLQNKLMPGCVVAVGRRGRIVLLRAYGQKQIEPEPLAMTVDAVFDMASLTKPIATATSVMILVDRGMLRLDDRVARHIPDFGQNGKEAITVYELLTHQGGLVADNSLTDYADGPQEAWRRIFALRPKAPPGTQFIYSDMGYIVLGELVRRVSGQPLDEFARENIYRPLSMTETGYLPGDELRGRAAPTEKRDGAWMQGEVHDPRAYLLGGVAGHAGLFSTAEDLAVFAQMMLDGGEYEGVRILSRRTVAVMTAGYPVSSGLRGLGWDVQTGYSSNRGKSFSASAFGHGGFTGTVLWMDPGNELFVIFLSNRLHPDGKGSVNPLAGRIGTIAADAVCDGGEKGTGTFSAKYPEGRSGKRRLSPFPRPVLTGIDVLERDGFRRLEGRRVGLITNQTGIDRQGTSTARLLAEAKNVELVALFSPEHGLEGKLDVSRIGDGSDPTTGLPVFSLYGESRRPKPEDLKGIDTLVFDIQDIGTRFYTYVSTMGLAMEAAAQEGIRFVVLDRPNPIGGLTVAGPVLDAGRESFTGFHPIAVQHGMTVGELARMFNAERNINAKLEVVPVEGWRRCDLLDATDLRWINPSPNMRSLTEAVLYPGVGLLETTNLSVGRGTEIPFEVIGAPWLDGSRLAAALDAAGLCGVEFVPIAFTPTASKFAGELCGGLRILVTDRDAFQSVRTGLQIARQLRLLYPEAWKAADYDRLLADRAVLEAVLAGKSVDEIDSTYQAELAEFCKRRSQYLLYQ
jgi:uncharacterized protein YbbC (DUF1343 family)